MLRTIGATIAAICTIGLLGAPTAHATPKMCDNHGTGKGLIYKSACAGGGGGGNDGTWWGPNFSVESGKIKVGPWKCHGANCKDDE